MAREIVTHVWCDVCMATEDVRAEAVETPPITLGSMKPRVLALCDTHMKDVYEPFKDLLTDLGQVVPTGANAPTVAPPGTGRSSGSGVFPCPVPGCHKGPGKPFRHIQSLRNHTRDVHHIPIQELKARYGDPYTYADTVGTAPVEDLFGEEDAPSITRAECPEEGCDVVYEWPRNKRPAQALGVHRQKVHGYTGNKKRKGARG